MKKRVIIGAVILLVVLYAFRVYKVNSEIRAVKEVIIPFGTEREVSNNVNMKINGYTVLSKEEAKEKYDYDLEMDEEVKIILVNVTYFNKTNKSKIILNQRTTKYFKQIYNISAFLPNILCI